MSTANRKRSARGFPNLHPTVLITKTLIGAAIALGSAVGASGPASADPSLFGTLSCSCQGTAPASGPVLRREIDQGIQQGLLTGVPRP